VAAFDLNCSMAQNGMAEGCLASVLGCKSRWQMAGHRHEVSVWRAQVTPTSKDGVVLSDAGLTLFASPFLGPCKLQELNLSNQGGICHGIAALAGGRFPGL
jgi:hypothetical protein